MHDKRGIVIQFCYCSYGLSLFLSTLKHDFFSVYDALTGEIVKTLKQQRDCVRDVSWHPYLNEIVGSSWDQTVYKWEHRSDLEEDEEEFACPIKIPNSMEPKKKLRLHF